MQGQNCQRDQRAYLRAGNQALGMHSFGACKLPGARVPESGVFPRIWARLHSRLSGTSYGFYITSWVELHSPGRGYVQRPHRVSMCNRRNERIGLHGNLLQGRGTQGNQIQNFHCATLVSEPKGQLGSQVRSRETAIKLGGWPALGQGQVPAAPLLSGTTQWCRGHLPRPTARGTRRG